MLPRCTGLARALDRARRASNDEGNHGHRNESHRYEDAGVATPPWASFRVDRTERRFHSECLEFIRNEDSVGTRNEGWLIGFICSTCYSVDSVGRSIDPGPTDAHHQRPPPPITLTAGSVNSPIVADVPFSMWISILDHNFGQYP
jgi:hypothetical protein